MSFVLFHKGILVHSGNNWRSNQTKTGANVHFRICRFGFLIPLSYESNSLADYLDHGISALVMPKDTGLKAVLIATNRRLVEVTAVRDKDGAYDTSCVISQLDVDATYFLGHTAAITDRLAIAVQEKDPITATIAMMKATFDAKFKKPKHMSLSKIVSNITADKTNTFGEPFFHFRNPDYNP